jgi:ABC-type transport system substrate-binding protein
MKRILLSFVVLSVLILTSCGGEEGNVDTNNTQEIEAVNDNGCLDFAITEKYGSLDPIHVTDVASFHITSQIFEPLLRLDEKNLALKPLLAESWEVAEDNLTHTITLKKGVFFHDNKCFSGGKGRELKANDVVYSFNRMFSSEDNYAFSLLKNTIAGSNDYKANGEVSGIKAIDDYTVEFVLSKPSPNFLNLLATVTTSIVAQEAQEAQAVVGTGPFTYSSIDDTEEAVVLQRNTNYHVKDKKGEQLPYLNCVAFNYVKSGQEQLDLFMKGELDVITGLPSKSIKEIVEEQISDFQETPVKYILGRYPQAATSYLNLNTAKKPFNNLKVRQAIAHAINKNKIVDDILKGEAAAPGDHGIVTAAIDKYDYTSIVGLEFNVEKAKELLASAGYKNGKDFPTLILATGKGNTSLRIAFEIQKQLVTNLNINVEISSVTLAEKNAMNDNSECHMSINGWLAEFPDPLSFLSLYYGKNVPEDLTSPSFPNAARFKSAEFDKLYEQASSTMDQQKRYELSLAADQIIASEVPGIPLWYHEDYHLIQSTVNRYQPNAMNIQYLVHVKMEAPSTEKTAAK